MQNFILGDCLRVMPTLASRSVDLVVTDPPYLVDFTDRSGRSIANDRDPHQLEPAFAEMHRILAPDSLAISFYGWNKVDLFMAAWRNAGFRVVGHMVFAKRYASSSRFLRYQHESAYLLAKGGPPIPQNPLPDVMDWQYSGNRLHPTQKPLGVLTRLIGSFCRPGGLVFDPFAGSGTTCAAAIATGREFLGIEIDPNYHAAATHRLRAALDARDHDLPLAAQRRLGHRGFDRGWAHSIAQEM